MCNTVAYNLMSACDMCQGEPWISYSEWIFNCTSVSPPGTVSEPIPAGTRIPRWAYLDPTANNTWSVGAAQLAGDSPEVTGSASNIVPTSTKGQTTHTPQKTSSPSTSSSFKGSTNTGAIAGGVVGAILGAALIAGIVLWFTIRRRRARSAAPNGGNMGQVIVPYPLRIYNPADPSTYPTQGSPPLMMPPVNLNHGGQFSGSSSTLRPNQPAYSGLPEL